jgi:hypothetical protein
MLHVCGRLQNMSYRLASLNGDRGRAGVPHCDGHHCLEPKEC